MKTVEEYINHIKAVIKQFEDGGIIECEMINNIYYTTVNVCTDEVNNWYEKSQGILDSMSEK